LKDLPTGVDRNGHHWIGARDPLVTIVEYSDYQCPFCRRAHKDMRLMAGKYADSVRLIHRHLPLDRACNKDIKRVFHARACEFAKAAECAAKQNAFWGMNDALFSIQETTRAADVDLEAIAVTLGLDRSQFMACVEAPEVPRKIKEDMAASRKLDVKGTPTFFIGAQDFSGSIPEIALENAVKRARKKK
jgi:protein-disulfide isomerase